MLAAIFTVGPARAHTLAGGVAGVRPRTHCTYAWGATGAGEHGPHAQVHTLICTSAHTHPRMHLL